MNKPFKTSEGRQVRRNPWYLGLASTPLVLSFAALVAGLGGSPRFLAVVFHPLLIGLFALLYVWRKNPSPSLVPLRVRAGDEGVRLGDRLVPRAEIREAYVVPEQADKPARVRLVRKGLLPSIELAVDDAEQGRRLLRAIGLDASQSVATFRTLSQAVGDRRLTPAIVAALVLSGGLFGFMSRAAKAHPAAGGAMAIAAACAILVFAGVMLAPTTLRVGADGLATSWLGRRRFLGYGDILDVERYSQNAGRSRVAGIAVTLQSGERVALPIDQGSWESGRIPIIHERIREAMETFRQGGTAADAALLRRGERSLADWVVELRSIGAGANVGMRTAPIGRDRLFRVLEDPQAAHTARAAAAIALGADGDDDDRERLRIAAEAVAAPRLRIAIESAAKGDAGADAALAEIEAEEAEEIRKAHAGKGQG